MTDTSQNESKMCPRLLAAHKPLQRYAAFLADIDGSLSDQLLTATKGLLAAFMADM